MRREDLAHLLRAASQIAGDVDVVVIGSQSILGSYTETQLPEAAYASQEADLTFFDDPDDDKSDQVDGAIGEDSMFHLTNGYYGQGVSVSTATLPAGWRDRIVVLESQSTRPGRGLCLEPHDLVASKLFAGREKDFSFATALLDCGLIDAATLRERADALPTVQARRRWVTDWIDTWVRRRTQDERP